jgi:hypothetical protein
MEEVDEDPKYILYTVCHSSSNMCFVSWTLFCPALIAQATPHSRQHPLTDIKTVAQREATKPRTIAITAMISGVRFYRP